MMQQDAVDFIRETFNATGFIPLHEPKFIGNEIEYLSRCINSTFVSSVGEFVDSFEKKVVEYTGAKYAVATNSGTSALHMSMLLAGVKKGDEVITQPITFVATCNAMAYCQAKPIFVDVDMDTLGMSPVALDRFLKDNAEVKNGKCFNKITGKIISACVPMHTFGHACKIEEISDICKKWNIIVVEDAAESFGTLYKEKHTGRFGKLGIFSFNGNKIITGGTGGCIITDDESLAKRARHISTTAKTTNKLGEFIHDEVAYNYRMSNVNAAILVAQLENIGVFIDRKRDLAYRYKKFFNRIGVKFVTEPQDSKSNYWLNAIILESKKQRDDFLKFSNDRKLGTRPIWTPMNKLKMYENSQCGNLQNSLWLSDRVINIPSSVILNNG